MEIPKMYYFQQNISNKNGKKSQNTTEYKDGVLTKDGDEVKMTPKEFLEYLHKKNQTVSPNVLEKLFPSPFTNMNSLSSKCNCGCNCDNCMNCCNKSNNMFPTRVRTFVMRGGKLSTIPTDLIPYP